jgi:hypothetical protein
MKRILLFLYFIISLSLKAQTYYFDSILIGQYKGIIYEHMLSDTTIISVCNNDTLGIDEDNYPQGVYLNVHDSCWNKIHPDFVQYYSDTSFVRIPASCQCLNGKYFSFNDSLKLKFFMLPTFNDRFYWFYGKKYWSPVTGWVGIKEDSKVTDPIFDVYPNPSKTKATIAFSNGYLPIYSKGIISDINGKEILSFELSQDNASAIINTEILSNGVYFIKLQDYNRMFIKKMIISH